MPEPHPQSDDEFWKGTLRQDWLPGDGSLRAIREEHEFDCIKNIDPGAVKPSPYQLARVAFLLQQIDTRDATIAELRAEVERLRDALDEINRWSSPSPTRTFDKAIRDLEWITSVARRSLASPQPDAGAEPEDMAQRVAHQSLRGEVHIPLVWGTLAPSPSPEAAPPSAPDVAHATTDLYETLAQECGVSTGAFTIASEWMAETLGDIDDERLAYGSVGIAAGLARIIDTARREALERALSEITIPTNGNKARALAYASRIRKLIQDLAPEDKA